MMSDKNNELKIKDSLIELLEESTSNSKDIDFVKELNPNSAQFSIVTPFPGTDYFKKADEDGLLLTKDWSKYDGSFSCVLRTDEMDESEIRKACEIASMKWEKHRKKRDIKKKPFKYLLIGLKHPKESLNTIKEFLR